MRAIPTPAIITAPTYQNCSNYDVVAFATGFMHRLTITANGNYRAYAGLYEMDAEIV
jgi:hypothetical protein